MAAVSHAADVPHFDDALCAVQFVDEHEGWAVGTTASSFTPSTAANPGNDNRQAFALRCVPCTSLLPSPAGSSARKFALPPRQQRRDLRTRDGGITWERAARTPCQASRRFSSSMIAMGSSLARLRSIPHGHFPHHGRRRDLDSCSGTAPAGLAGRRFHRRGQWPPGRRLGIAMVLRQDKLVPRKLTLWAAVRAASKSWATELWPWETAVWFWCKDSAGARYGFDTLKLPAEVRACLDFRSVCLPRRRHLDRRPARYRRHAQRRSWRHLGSVSNG